MIAKFFIIYICFKTIFSIDLVIIGNFIEKTLCCTIIDKNIIFFWYLAVSELWYRRFSLSIWHTMFFTSKPWDFLINFFRSLNSGWGLNHYMLRICLGIFLLFFIFNILFIFMIIVLIFFIIIIIFYVWVLTWNTLKIYKNTSFWTSFVFKSLSFWLLNIYKPCIQKLFFLSYFYNFAVLFFIFTVNSLLLLFL